MMYTLPTVQFNQHVSQALLCGFIIAAHLANSGHSRHKQICSRHTADAALVTLHPDYNIYRGHVNKRLEIMLKVKLPWECCSVFTLY